MSEGGNSPDTQPTNFSKVVEVQQASHRNKQVDVEWNQEKGGYIMTTSVNFGPLAWSITKWKFDKDGNMVSLGIGRAVGEGNDIMASSEDFSRDESGKFIRTGNYQNHEKLKYWRDEFRKYQQTTNPQ